MFGLQRTPIQYWVWESRSWSQNLINPKAAKWSLHGWISAGKFERGHRIGGDHFNIIHFDILKYIVQNKLFDLMCLFCVGYSWFKSRPRSSRIFVHWFYSIDFSFFVIWEFWTWGDGSRSCPVPQTLRLRSYKGKSGHRVTQAVDSIRSMWASLTAMKQQT